MTTINPKANTVKTIHQLLYVLLLSFGISCNNSTNHHTQRSDTTLTPATGVVKPQTGSDSIQPVWGYRFQLTGDFDGDGVPETLKEHFYSYRDHQETNKFFTGIDDVFVLYDSVYTRDCRAFLLCSNPRLDTIPIGGILGPLWLRNEGNLDKEAGDEIAYVESLPQVSSMNHCYILSFKKGKWKVIYGFPVREWQFPPLPGAGKTYGFFGTDGAYTVGEDDTLNTTLQQQLDAFPGPITRLRSGKVSIQTFTAEAFDTTLVVDLSKHPKAYN